MENSIIHYHRLIKMDVVIPVFEHKLILGHLKSWFFQQFHYSPMHYQIHSMVPSYLVLFDCLLNPLKNIGKQLI